MCFSELDEIGSPAKNGAPGLVVKSDWVSGHTRGLVLFQISYLVQKLCFRVSRALVCKVGVFWWNAVGFLGGKVRIVFWLKVRTDSSIRPKRAKGRDQRREESGMARVQSV